MKYLLTLIVAVIFFTATNAQTSGGANASAQRRIPPPKKANARQQRGSGQYHGNRDTTPGSPMGTGGAGGDMSGSAIETDDQTNNVQTPNDTIASGESAVSKKTTTRKTKTVRRKTKNTL